jgi:hypothetical protein
MFIFSFSGGRFWYFVLDETLVAIDFLRYIHACSFSLDCVNNNCTKSVSHANRSSTFIVVGCSQYEGEEEEETKGNCVYFSCSRDRHVDRNRTHSHLFLFIV